jgi:DDB1- and CUL4-associated factor 11
MQSTGSPRSDDRESRTIGLTGISLQDLSRLLSARSSQAGGIPTGRNHIADDEDEAEDDNDDVDEYSDSFRQAVHQWFPDITEPQKAGMELLTSGDFGRVAAKLRSRRSDVNVAKLIYKRSMRPKPVSYKEDYASVRISDANPSRSQYLHLVQDLIPNSDGTAVASYDANIYSGQYSAGNDN